jgi:hypothetical protein
MKSKLWPADVTEKELISRMYSLEGLRQNVIGGLQRNSNKRRHFTRRVCIVLS